MNNSGRRKVNIIYCLKWVNRAGWVALVDALASVLKKDNNQILVSHVHALTRESLVFSPMDEYLDKVLQLKNKVILLRANIVVSDWTKIMNIFAMVFYLHNPTFVIVISPNKGCVESNSTEKEFY